MDYFNKNSEVYAFPGAANEREPATLTLNEEGLICDCSFSGERLFGYLRGDLVWQHISKLFPQLSEIVLVKNSRINPRLGFLCHCGHHFQGRGREGDVFLSELSFVHLGNDSTDRQILRLIVRPFEEWPQKALP